MTGFLGAIVSHKVKSKFFLDIRDIFSETIEDIFSKKISALLLPMITIIEKYTMSRADRVNLVSRGFESYFSKKYPNNDYCFITNGIDQEFIDFFDEEYFSSKSRMTEPRGLRPLKIFYAGNIGEGQGLDKILPEMATIIKEDAEFTIVGDGSGLVPLQKVIFEKNISNIVIHKPVPRDELLKFYLRSDILFLHLNNYDAFKKVLPSKIFEYAATGLPILAGVDGYSKEFLQENVENSRIFTPCNAKEAIDEMNMLDFDSTNRKEFKENYSRKKTSEMLVSRFIELL
jgi:glycosyltransferase involved in cell wall biosynthesis